MLFPIAIGIPVFSTFDSVYWGDKATSLSFALFVSVAASITAISVVARTLGDLKLNGTEQSTLALSACAINDLFGWLLFTLVLSLVGTSYVDFMDLAVTVLVDCWVYSFKHCVWYSTTECYTEACSRNQIGASCRLNDIDCKRRTVVRSCNTVVGYPCHSWLFHSGYNGWKC